METREEHQQEAQQELQRAHLLMSYGHFEKALDACDRAESLLGDDPLPGAIKGSVLLAAGKVKPAMVALNRHYNRHKESFLTGLYLAEACFLSRRSRRGWKILGELEERGLRESSYAQLGEELRAAWEQLEELDQLAPLLEVPFDESGGRP